MTPPQNVAELIVDKGNLQGVVLRKELYGFAYFSVAKNNTRIALRGETSQQHLRILFKDQRHNLLIQQSSSLWPGFIQPCEQFGKGYL